MIETMDLTKKFGTVTAVNHVSLCIKPKEVFGLVGTNGAGKSTFMRILAGVLRQDEGTVLLDREPVFDNPEVKKEIFFIPNDFYFFYNATGEEMRDYFKGVYERFDAGRFDRLTADFALDKKRRIAEFSKGMKRQIAIILGLCSGTKYLLCDETFDGLDPVMRQAVKSLFAKDMEDRGLTPVITSHNLREIEDICDHIGLLHQGGVLLSEDIADMKLNIQKVQCVFAAGYDEQIVLENLDVIGNEKRGRLHTITIRGTRQETENSFRQVPLVFFEVLPLSLEEIFISETESAGYDIRKLILD